MKNTFEKKLPIPRAPFMYKFSIFMSFICGYNMFFNLFSAHWFFCVLNLIGFGFWFSALFDYRKTHKKNLSEYHCQIKKQQQDADIKHAFNFTNYR